MTVFAARMGESVVAKMAVNERMKVARSRRARLQFYKHIHHQPFCVKENGGENFGEMYKRIIRIITRLRNEQDLARLIIFQGAMAG